MIQLDDKYYIGADQFQYFIFSMTVDKEGRERRKHHSFHATLGGALDYYLRWQQRERLSQGVYDLVGAVEMLQECNETVTRLIQQFETIGVVEMEVDETEEGEKQEQEQEQEQEMEADDK